MISKATCPKCQAENLLPECSNCGGVSYTTGPLSDGSVGVICKACNMGRSHFACQAGCGAWISALEFGTPVSRAARRIHENMQQNRGQSCFIATELYGPESEEVAMLRRYRDRVLLKSRIGSALVRAYYRIGPKLIPVMRRFGCVRVALRSGVGAIVRCVRRRSVSIKTSSARR